MNELYERLGGIDSKLDQLLTNGTDHEGRLRTVETRQSRIFGALGLLTVAVPLLVHFVR